MKIKHRPVLEVQLFLIIIESRKIG